jgi:hypothetical protein
MQKAEEKVRAQLGLSPPSDLSHCDVINVLQKGNPFREQANPFAANKTKLSVRLRNREMVRITAEDFCF